MKEHLERELKLDPGDGFVLPELGGRPLPSRTFTSTYHDTADLALARNGVTFRHRVEGGAGVWQLKLPRGAARVELEEPGPPARPPQVMLDLLYALLRGEAVRPIARLRTRREGIVAQGAEITQDSVAVLDGQRVTRRFHELEVELLEGDERTLRRLEKELRRAGAQLADPGQRPKVFRALDLAAPNVELVAPADAGPRDVITHALREQRRRLLLHDPGTRLGNEPEELHQLRVAIRRLRAMLRAGRGLLDPPWATPLRGELGWLGNELGPARDLDVLIERVRRDVATLGDDADIAAALLVGLDAERTVARGAALDALSSDRYLRLLDQLDGVAEPQFSDVEPSLRSLWRREWKRTRTAIVALPSSPSDDALHAARISIKRVRYAAELAAPELRRQGKAFARAAKEAQELLGEHQDACVAEERIRVWSEASPGTALGAGRLIQVEQERKAAVREQWPAAWKRLRQAGRALQ